MRKFQDSKTVPRAKQNAPVAATRKKKGEDWRFQSESDIQLDIERIQH